ncbi:MAG: preprotein translocase subunit SecA [Mariniphaga sp.]
MSFLNKVLSSFFGNKSQKDIKEVMPVLQQIKQEYLRMPGLSNDELRTESALIRKKIRDYIKTEEDEIASLKEQAESGTLPLEEGEKIYDKVDKLEELILKRIEEVLNEVLPTAFAIVKDTARRFMQNEIIEVTTSDFDRDLSVTKDFVEIDGDKAIYKNEWIAGGTLQKWNMLHYDVQLIGGIVLHSGKISEMGTGEGKTLVATLPVFLNALAGRGVHVVTVNDYLAKRDSEWMGPIYQFHGISVDCIDKHQPNSPERRKAYDADITFGTNNEFGFDYLRDNMAVNPSDLVQRKHHYAIVDEVDSVLIDDARTPLIISGPVPKGENQLFDEFKGSVERLVKSQRELVNQYLVEAKKKIGSSNSKESDEGALALFRAYKGLPKHKPLIRFLSEEGNKAKMLKVENFYMADNNKNMYIATDPLFFVIEEKLNSIELTDNGIEILSKDNEDGGFFVLPDVGAEIADIQNNKKLSEAEQLDKKDILLQNFAIKSERVHTVNQLLKAYTMFEKDIEYVLIEGKVKIVDEQTGRIMEGRRYSDGLHQAIEAKERVKVEDATQTFATITLQNFFRMYHKLSGMTGTAETEAGELWDIYKLEVVVIPTNVPVIRKDQEDLVYKTKKEKYNAIIDEIVKLNKKGQPMLVGTTSVEISELLSRMLQMRGIKHQVLNAKRHQQEADIVAEAGKLGMVTIATNMAGRGTDIKLTSETRELGGLAIIGTERHESRRVDRQLRGRSGRQGDPGYSQFFVSLEDDLMRLFSSDRIVSIMDKLGLKDGEVISHSMISKSIERAQKKVEENNFGIRKRLLEYDDVMNSQREVIYKKRRHALFGERIDVDILNMIYDMSELITTEHQPNGKEGYEDFRLDLIRSLSLDVPVTEDEFVDLKPSETGDKVYHAAIANFTRRAQSISKQAWPVIKNVYETKAHIYNNIVVPITDGLRLFQIVTNLEKAYKTSGQDLVKSYEKQVILATIDEHWKENLRELDELRTSVQNASYEQKDPLLIYKLESFNLFKAMMERINKGVVSTLMKGQIPISDPEQVREAPVARRHTDRSQLREEKSDLSSGGKVPEKGEEKPVQHQQVRVTPKVGRNEPCPCGSGKKYKNCHGHGLV